MNGVIFKLNRILFQDSDKQKIAWMVFARMEFHRDISHLDFDIYVYGQSYKSVMEYLADRPLTNRKVTELVEKQEAVYRTLCKEDKAHFSLTCGAAFLLNELKERHIPRLLVIESDKSNYDFYRENFRIDEWFSPKDIMYVDNIVPGKPDSDFYVRAIQEINLPGENCIVFEHTISGIRAAKKAGIGKVVAIVPRNKQYVFENMNEVDDVIGNFHEFDRFLLNEISWQSMWCG